MKRRKKEPMLKADGFDKAVLGIGRRCGQPDLIVYDLEKCAKILMKRDGLSYDDAVEFLEFNSVGAWMGAGTPLWLERKTMKDIEAEYA